MGWGERERDRETERETERPRDRATPRETERERYTISGQRGGRVFRGGK